MIEETTPTPKKKRGPNKRNPFTTVQKIAVLWEKVVEEDQARVKLLLRAAVPDLFAD